MFPFDSLPAVGIKGVLCDIAIDVDFCVLVALSDDPSLSLLDVAWSPGYIDVMQCDQTLLYICACTHLFRRAEQHTHFSFSYLFKEGFFLLIGACVVDICDLFRRNTHVDQMVFDAVIDVGKFLAALGFIRCG